ncbi:MAG: hypothetical protein ACRDWI_18505 [Jiangellaceae bacterium]
MIEVVRSAPGRWTVTREGEAIGRLEALVRPDQRCLLLFRDCSAEAHRPLLDVALAVLDRDAYVEVDEVLQRDLTS